MDRRGFVGTGMAAGLVGVGGAATSLSALLERTPGWSPGKTLPDGSVKLASNENALGLCESARQAVIDAIPHANRYPSDYTPELLQELAKYMGVKEDNLILGAGSTEILQMTVQAFQGPKVRLVIADPTFEDVPRYQHPLSFNLIRVPLTDTYAHDIARMREHAEGSRRPSIVYFCNPNNPTGTITESRGIDAWIADAPETTTFLMDEAYFDYVDNASYWSALKWIDTHPNVVVVRTFSKIFAMAGLRVGYAVAHPDTIVRLTEYVAKNSPNVLATAAGIASLRDSDHTARSLEVNEVSKKIVHDTCDELGLECLPSDANFTMHRINGDLDAYIQRMADAGVRVGRPFPPMLEWSRLSYGLPEEQNRWAETLKGFRAKGWV
jgi:histidinol-phosphate aminotransferase